MPIIARDPKKDYLPAPEGLHQAVCVDVLDLGLQETPWGSKEKVEIRWQLEEINTETAKRFIVPKRYTLSLNEKASLRKDLEAWRGKKFTREELGGFDLEKLIGVNCQVQVVHNILDDGRVFGNIQAIVPLGKGMEKIAPSEYERVKDRPKQVGASSNGGSVHPGDEDDESIPF